MPESSSEAERNERLEEAVVEALKMDPKSPEARALLLQWTIQGEQVVTAENTSRATLVFNLRRALLYEKAGLQEVALEAFEDACLEALNENELELLAEAREGMRRLEGKE